MRISEVRDEIAALCGMSQDNLRVRTDQLYRQPELREALPGRRHGGGDNTGLTATYAASALVTLAAMLGYSRDKIGPAVVRMWQAKLVTPRTENPLEKFKSTGALLTLLLQRSDARSRLAFFEVDHDIPHCAFEFDRGSRLVYAPYQPKQWARRVDRAFKRGEMAHVTRIGPTTLEKIAALVDRENQPQHQQ